MAFAELEWRRAYRWLQSGAILSAQNLPARGGRMFNGKFDGLFSSADHSAVRTYCPRIGNFVRRLLRGPTPRSSTNVPMYQTERIATIDLTRPANFSRHMTD